MQTQLPKANHVLGAFVNLTCYIHKYDQLKKYHQLNYHHYSVSQKFWYTSHLFDFDFDFDPQHFKMQDFNVRQSCSAHKDGSEYVPV